MAADETGSTRDDDVHGLAGKVTGDPWGSWGEGRSGSPRFQTVMLKRPSAGAAGRRNTKWLMILRPIAYVLPNMNTRRRVPTVAAPPNAPEAAPGDPKREFAEDEAGSGTIRQIVLILVLFGATWLTLELLLLEHTESAWQWMPLAVLAAGISSSLAVAARPTPHLVRLFRTVMMLFVATGLFGVYLHYTGNTEFELEMDAAARGLDLLWRSLQGATPVLAPGAMAQLGLFGLAYAYRHPALRRQGSRRADPDGSALSRPSRGANFHNSPESPENSEQQEAR